MFFVFPPPLPEWGRCSSSQEAMTTLSVSGTSRRPRWSSRSSIRTHPSICCASRPVSPLCLCTAACVWLPRISATIPLPLHALVDSSAPTGAPLTLVCGTDRKWLAVAGNPHVRLFRNDSQAPGHTLQLDGHAGPVTGVAFSPDCAILYTGGEDKHVKIWELRSGKCMHSLTCATAINGLSVHPSLPLLVAAELGGALSVWDLKTRQRLREIMLEEDVALRSCCFAPDASALVCGSNSGSSSHPLVCGGACACACRICCP